MTLTNVTITDPAFPSLSCTIPSLAPGGVWNGCSASTTLSQAQVDAGSVSNTATVTGTPPAGATPNPTTASDTETVTIDRSPSLSIVKTGTLDNDDVAPASRTDAGDKIVYTFLVTNTGNVTLTNVVVTDPLAGLSPINCPPAASTLDPGEFQVCTASLVLNQAHIDAGSVGNTATVSGTPPAGSTPNPTTASDDETVTIDQVATISIDKAGILVTSVVGQSGRAEVGDRIDYTFLVTNTGNVTLNGVTVTDPSVSVSCPAAIDPLDPGESVTCTASHTLSQD